MRGEFITYDDLGAFLTVALVIGAVIGVFIGKMAAKTDK